MPRMPGRKSEYFMRERSSVKALLCLYRKKILRFYENLNIPPPIKSTNIYPIEVRSGKTGRLKSLHVFMDEKKCDIGIRISQHQFSFSCQSCCHILFALTQTRIFLFFYNSEYC